MEKAEKLNFIEDMDVYMHKYALRLFHSKRENPLFSSNQILFSSILFFS